MVVWSWLGREQLGDLPSGVVVEDANKIWPRDLGVRKPYLFLTMGILDEVGGWFLAPDMCLVEPLPDVEMFFSLDGILPSSRIMKIPKSHELPKFMMKFINDMPFDEYEGSILGRWIDEMLLQKFLVSDNAYFPISSRMIQNVFHPFCKLKIDKGICFYLSNLIMVNTKIRRADGSIYDILWRMYG